MAINFWQQLKKNRFMVGGGVLGAGAGVAGAARAFDPIVQAGAQSQANCLNSPDACDSVGDFTAAGSSGGSVPYTKEDILNDPSEAWGIYLLTGIVCAVMVAVPSIILAAVGSAVDKKNKDQDQAKAMQIQDGEANKTFDAVL